MSRFANLDACLAWLETLHPKAIDMGLERVRQVAAALGVLEPGAQVVTVAGTNGKGSTTALLEALLLAQGRRVACYTSPHILRFSERIRIAGRDAADADILRALEQVDAARGDISLTYFEFTTLAAFLLFREAAVDCWILEVGLGGRLDAVNVIDPDVAVLTSVGLDHQEWLGDTREAIGREKAGIFRAGRPAVIGDPHPPLSVDVALTALRTSGWFVGRDFSYALEEGGRKTWHWRGRGREGEEILLDSLPLPALAPANAATALQALHLLLAAPQPAAIREALARVRLGGRNQCITVAGRELVLDVGHNADGLSFLRAELARTGRGECFHVVLGMLADKDLAAAARVLEPLGQSWHIAPLPSPRSATAVQLQGVLVAAGAHRVYAHADMRSALAAALARDDDLPVLVTGSFYTVSEAMKVLNEVWPESLSR